MKITKIEVVYPSYKASLRAWRPNLWQIITRVHTDNSNIFGYGTGGGGLASVNVIKGCLLYTSPSPRDLSTSRMPSSA